MIYQLRQAITCLLVVSQSYSVFVLFGIEFNYVIFFYIHMCIHMNFWLLYRTLSVSIEYVEHWHYDISIQND